MILLGLLLGLFLGAAFALCMVHGPGPCPECFKKSLHSAYKRGK
jgi:hypothetical protein